MKIVIHTVFAALSVCSALADNITVQSFPIKSSAPSVKHLLDQPPVIHKGKIVAVPYTFCGVLTEAQMKKYCDTSKASKASSKTRLPNGAFCQVEVISTDATTDPDDVKIKIDITGPQNQGMQSEISTYMGQGILLRCETGKDLKNAEIIVLQINKQKG